MDNKALSQKNLLTLKLFNGVIEGSKDTNADPIFNTDYGVVIDPRAVHAKDEILEFLEEGRRNKNDYNKTFHKSWAKVQNSSRLELLVHQIIHYITTYGTDFTAPIYIPDEVLDVPDANLRLVPIKAFTKKELVAKSLNLLRSGVALKEDTVRELIDLLVELDYTFTGDEGIRNKEAIVVIAEVLGVYPKQPEEFLRFLIYRATGTTLLIKNDKLVAQIKESTFNPAMLMKDYGLDRLAQIFNRYKPLFLAFKKTCPGTINKISKLSKVHHVPLVENPLNLVTQRRLQKEKLHWLENATPYALFKALNACHSRLINRTAFLYQIRNGKAWVSSDATTDKTICTENFKIILNFLQKKYDFSGLKVFIPGHVQYALPTSEKMFVGNVPTGTKFFGDNLAAGVYWENDWGASDLDISALNVDGKVGWNADYDQDHKLTYSGDITSAPNGAVEYIRASGELFAPSLILNNVFTGSEDCGYKIIVGQGDDVDREYMMNPNNLLLDVKTQSVQRQTILGIMLQHYDVQSFVVLNVGCGSVNVSGHSPVSDRATVALIEQWSNTVPLDYLLAILGAQIVSNKHATDFDIDLSLEQLEKDTILKLFQ